MSFLQPQDDIAHVKWGGNWQIPTVSQWEELISYCVVEEIAIWNVTQPYLIIRSRLNGNGLILPLVGFMSGNTLLSWGEGFYWANSIHLSDNDDDGSTANYLYISPQEDLYISSSPRWLGMLIRPCFKKRK